MTNKSYISNILLAIIPFLLIAGYFERYINLLPQYFNSQQVYATEDSVDYKGVNFQLEELEKISLTLVDDIKAIDIPQWKVNRVYNYLSQRGAPLASKSKFLVQAAAYYRIDYRLVAAISVIESSGGKHTYRPFNAWGWGGAENAFTFKSWEESITTVSRGLASYYAGGAVTPAQIAPRYNPHTPQEWSRKVAFVMEQM